MNFFLIAKELISKFAKNRRGEHEPFWGYFWIVFFPLLCSGLSVVLIGTNAIFSSNFSQIYISVISIFAAFYISLLVYTNQKVNEINAKHISDQTERNNSLRTVNNSRKLTIYLIYSLGWIIVSITLILISNFKACINECLPFNAIKIICGFVGYLAMYSFVVMLFKILHNSQSNFIKDITAKASEISNKNF